MPTAQGPEEILRQVKRPQEQVLLETCAVKRVPESIREHLTASEGLGGKKSANQKQTHTKASRQKTPHLAISS